MTKYPWIKGHLACGKTEDDNPYPHGTRQHAAWLDGLQERQFLGGWVGPNAAREIPPPPWDEVTDDERQEHAK